MQEAHLTKEFTDNIHNLFRKRLQVLYSQGENTNAKGVMFVLNKEIINTEEITLAKIIPARALLLTILWHTNLVLTILNVYTPNNTLNNTSFWATLQKEFDSDSCMRSS